MSEDKLKLTPKERAFCHHYATIRNATKATIAAGYSAATAGQRGYELLQKEDIKKMIAYLEAERLAEADIKPIDLILELKKIAFANIGDFVEFTKEQLAKVDEDGEIIDRYNYITGVMFKDSLELNSDQLSTISEISETPLKSGGKALKVKMYSKIDAIKTLSTMLGYNAPDKKEVKHSIAGDALDRTAFSIKRRATRPPDATAATPGQS